MTGEEFLQAAANGDAEAVRRYLADGGDVDVRNERGMTALMLAAWRGHEDVAREVLKHSPDLSPRATDGWRALTYAAANTYERPDGARTDVLGILIAAGDRPEPGETDWKGLHYAAEWGHPQNLRLLLDRGMDPNVRDDEGRTALMRAARKSKADCVRVLLEHGADPNLSDPDGETALMYAAGKANLDQVEALLETGADASARNPSKQTALDIARVAKKRKVAKLLEGWE